ncbi:DUF6799 domain-containing protein [Hymenobacter cellulosilyticus]|uniref:DUF6799 domain-containing protein n=1 Tax=Hymenobacter cellulosilyticus TaxID=2932248 RepID=A0A8T9Q914_9BACT|nr:DUF6799 domain-containing protein [Hymenobacter cellulosilyticus]UOQ72891.1 hypothetical protein MUN79_02580 [Hymenobacter cellulosilyticus]
MAASFSAPGQSRSRNDGFQRQDGAMFVIRNGVRRPMTRDAHLPNGRIITRDGFVVSRDGHRTELAEGKGCDLNGTVVSVTGGGNAPVLLAPAGTAAVGPPTAAAAYLRQVDRGKGKGRGWGHHKKPKHGKGKHKKHDD